MIYHCTKCDHEWQVVEGYERDRKKCDWCGAKGKPCKSPWRVPTAKATVWHKDKKRYNRKQKHKGGFDE